MLVMMLLVSVKMGTMRLFVLVALLACVCAVPGNRVRRGYNNGGYESGGGYGRGSDERDTSGSEESGGCSGQGQGYSGRGYSGSRELAYSRDGRPSRETRGGRSFSRSAASAISSASVFNQNQRANIV